MYRVIHWRSGSRHIDDLEILYVVTVERDDALLFIVSISLDAIVLVVNLSEIDETRGQDAGFDFCFPCLLQLSGSFHSVRIGLSSDDSEGAHTIKVRTFTRAEHTGQNGDILKCLTIACRE